MYCPFCGKQDTKVIDSRLASEGAQVRRRRECLDCGERFTTFESPELVMPRIIKSNGAREPFVEEKMIAGMMRALEKRPVESERVDAAISRLQHRLRASGERCAGIRGRSRSLRPAIQHRLAGPARRP